MDGRGYGEARGDCWQDRPDHDMFYPDIAVPLELVPTFNIAAGNNQSIWADIYIPKTATAGRYTGQVTVTESGGGPHKIPVELTVLDFALADMPTAKSMLVISGGNINERYIGKGMVDGKDERRAKLIHDRHFLLRAPA